MHFLIQLGNMNCSRNHQETLSHCGKLRLLHHLSGQRFIAAKILCCRNTAPINQHFALSIALIGEEIFVATMVLQKKFWDRRAIAIRSNNIYLSLKGEVRSISALQKRALENAASFHPLWVLSSLWGRLLPLQKLPNSSSEYRWVFLIHISRSDWAHHPDFALERIRRTSRARCVVSNFQLVPKSKWIGKIFYGLSWIIFVKHLQVKELYKC